MAIIDLPNIKLLSKYERIWNFSRKLRADLQKMSIFGSTTVLLTLCCIIIHHIFSRHIPLQDDCSQRVVIYADWVVVEYLHSDRGQIVWPPEQEEVQLVHSVWSRHSSQWDIEISSRANVKGRRSDNFAIISHEDTMQSQPDFHVTFSRNSE